MRRPMSGSCRRIRRNAASPMWGAEVSVMIDIEPTDQNGQTWRLADTLQQGVDQAMLGEVAWPADGHPLAYVCGPTSFVETVAEGLGALGYPSERVRTERFGPTGGQSVSHDPVDARRPAPGRARGR